MEHAAIFRPFSRRGPDALTLTAARRLFECTLALRLLEGGAQSRMRRFVGLRSRGERRSSRRR